MCSEDLVKYKHERIPKLWGEEEMIVNTERYCGKILRLKRKHRSSLHYHINKDETFLCMDGTVLVEYGRDWLNEVLLRPGMSIRLLPGMPHRFEAIGDEAEVVEFSTPHDDGDVVRLEESR